MNGLAYPLASPVPVEFNGEMILFQSIGIRDFAMLESHLIRKKRADKMRVVADVRDALPHDVWEKMLDDARREAEKITVPQAEVLAWLQTPEGTAFAMWVSLEKVRPGKYTYEQVADIISKQPHVIASVQEAILDASGILGEAISASHGGEAAAENESQSPQKSSSIV